MKLSKPLDIDRSKLAPLAIGANDDFEKFKAEIRSRSAWHASCFSQLQGRNAESVQQMLIPRIAQSASSFERLSP